MAFLDVLLTAQAGVGQGPRACRAWASGALPPAGEEAGMSYCGWNYAAAQVWETKGPLIQVMQLSEYREAEPCGSQLQLTLYVGACFGIR